MQQGMWRRGVGVGGMVLATAMMAGTAAVAQHGLEPAQAGVSTSGGRDARSMSDPEFLDHAIMLNHAAIDAANLALQKGSSGEVKSVAQTVVSSHTQMLDQLKSVAKTVGWKYEDNAGPAGKRMVDRLQGLSGTAFDQAFLHDMLQLHKREAGMYEAEAGNAHSEPLMKLAGDQLPEIRNHLKDLEGVMQNGAQK